MFIRVALFSFLDNGPMKISRFIKRLFHEEDGPTAVEYAIMITMILGVIFATVVSVGLEASSFYEHVSVEMDDMID